MQCQYNAACAGLTQSADTALVACTYVVPSHDASKLLFKSVCHLAVGLEGAKSLVFAAALQVTSPHRKFWLVAVVTLHPSRTLRS